jgi:hypothetical protein
MEVIRQVVSPPPSGPSLEDIKFAREQVMERKLRSWVRSNCRAFQTLECNTVPSCLRVSGWERVVKDECRKINAALGTDLTED